MSNRLGSLSETMDTTMEPIMHVAIDPNVLIAEQKSLNVNLLNLNYT